MSDKHEPRYLSDFGKRVAAIRRSKGLTQEQVAEKTGITVISVGYVEQGRRWPRISTLHKLAKCLGVPIAELFKGLS